MSSQVRERVLPLGTVCDQKLSHCDQHTLSFNVLVSLQQRCEDYLAACTTTATVANMSSETIETKSGPGGLRR